MINDSMNYKRITIFAKDTQNDMKRFIGHTILILLAEIFLFCPTTMSQNNPYKINDQLYSYYQKCNSAIRKPEVLLMADTLFHMAKKKGDVKAQCLALNLKSDHYYHTDNIIALLKEKEKVADFARKTPYKQYIFGAWNRIITYYLRNWEYDTALIELKKYQSEALRLNNSYGIGQSYIQLGDVYFQQKMPQIAAQQYQQAVDYYKSAGKHNELYYPYYTLATCYTTLNDYKKAEEYTLKSIELSPNAKAKASAHLNLLRIYIRTKDFAKAEEVIRALKHYKESDILQTGALQNYYIIMATYFIQTKKYDDAMTYGDSIKNLQIQWELKSRIYEKMKDFETAYTYQLNSALMRDSLFQARNNELLANYNARFNNQKLELEKKQLTLQNTEMRLNRLQDREKMMLLEKEQTRIELENRNLQLEQQQTAIELEKAETQKQRLEVIHKQEQLQRIKMEQETNQRKIWVVFSILILISGFSSIYAFTRRQHARHLKIEKDAAEKARQQAEKADKLKSAFLQNLSHEIRTPLNAIIGFNDLLNDADAEFSEEERSELLGHLHTNTYLLLTLVNDVLDLSKLESGNYSISLSSVVLPELCQSTLAGVAHRVAEGVRLELKQPDTEIILNTDAQRLQQILTNLLVNACKYTSQGSIVLAYEIAGTSIIFSVTDTGCGIDKEKGELIFQRFEKLNSMNPGFGLGLSICRSLTTLLGGKIYLDTQYTGGARFVVELPLHPPV